MKAVRGCRRGRGCDSDRTQGSRGRGERGHRGSSSRVEIPCSAGCVCCEPSPLTRLLCVFVPEAPEMEACPTPPPGAARTLRFLPGVSGSCWAWAASSAPGRQQKHTHVVQNTPPSVHGELLLETSNFTDHGFGGKNVTPEVSGKLFTPGEMEMSRQMGQAPYWIPGWFTQRPAQPAPHPTTVSQPWSRWGSWRALGGVILPRPPMPRPPPSLSLHNCPST